MVYATNWNMWQMNNMQPANYAWQQSANYDLLNPTWSNYTGSSYVGCTPSSTSAESSTEEKKETKTESATEDGSSGLNMTTAERNACIEQEKQNKSKEHEAEHNLLASLGFSSVFVAPAAYKLIKGKCYGANKGVTDIFYSLDGATKKAKYEALFKDAPRTMIDAQETLTKSSRQAQSALKHAKTKRERKAINKGYKYLEDLMKKALNGGNADEVAQATEKIRAANKVTYKKMATTNTTKKQLVDNVRQAASNAKAIKGNSFIKHLGGKSGVVMGALMAGFTLFMSKDEIKEAYNKDAETGRKQLWHSIGKAVIPVVTFTGGDALGKWLTTKIISKGVTKIATKLVAKGAGKAIGAAIGSCVPGLGTVAGIAIGCVVDWAVSKYGPLLLAKIKGEDTNTAYNSPVEMAQIGNKTNEELFETIAIKKMQNQELTATEEEIINKNKKLYDSLAAQVMAQQAQQQTVATA